MMRYAKVIALIAILALPFVGLVIAKDGYWNTGNVSASLNGDLFKQLSVEAFSQSIPAPDFSLEDLEGNRLSLGDLRGKVVLLNFWATWCPACNLEMPSMESLHRELGNEGLVIIAVNFREGPEEVKSHLHKQQLSFKALLDRVGEIFARYETWLLPTTYLIGKDGELVGKVVGYRDWHSELARDLFRQLLENRT